jgi:hypothetical protein
MPAVMREDWIVPAMPCLELKPRVNSKTYIEVTVIIPKVVVAITRVAEQAELQITNIHDDAERVSISRPPVEASWEIHGSIQESPRRQDVIPVSSHKYIAMRGPGVMGRNPDPVVPRHQPVTRPEDIVAFPPVITWRHPNTVAYA